MSAYDSAAIILDEREDESACDVMAYQKLSVTLNQVDKAGRCLVNRESSRPEFQEAINIVFNWRAAHSYPLNSFYLTLNNRAKKTDSRASTAQRMKRLDSIFRKLLRRPTMQLSQMQDIGGCRAVVTGIKNLDNLLRLYESHPLRHAVRPRKDYIRNPKEDGYRSVHLMYRFTGKASSLPWDKLRIELQLRTKLQHSWATAVETVDAFTGEELKLGLGSEDWGRFFQLMGSVHALVEGSPLVPGTHTRVNDLRDEVRHIENKLQITQMLNSWSHIVRHITGIKSGRGFWYLIEIKPQEREATIKKFPLSKMREAESEYQEKELELRNSGSRNKAVLVSVDSMASLRKMYPNYFADTGAFITSLHRFLK